MVIYDDSDVLANNPPSPVVVVVLAIALAVFANGWIQQLLPGDQGLSSYLKDGSGCNRSNFRPLQKDDQQRAVASDPLPWLALPKLDFVEVAGQPQQSDYDDDDIVLLEQLEQMQSKMKETIENGELSKAKGIQEELEWLMVENGVTFTKD